MKRFFRTQERLAIVLCSMLLIVLVTACSSGSSLASNSPNITKQVTATVALSHVPFGSAQLNWNVSTYMLTVKVSLVGLAPHSKHAASIFMGDCSVEENQIYPLNTMTADAHGRATTTTTIANVRHGIPSSGWFLDVHNGQNLKLPLQFLPIVCENIVNSNTSTSASQSLRISLTSAPASSVGESASGVAFLTVQNGALLVQVTLSGLAPDSVHPVHIRKGSCESQGPTIYTLNPAVADDSGNEIVATEINHVSSIPRTGWYIDVNYSNALNTPTGFDPIACGNIQIPS
jgi:hypothetical protein